MKFKCEYCGKEFKSEEELRQHETECIAKIIHQRTTIIGKVEKFLESIGKKVKKKLIK